MSNFFKFKAQKASMFFFKCLDNVQLYNDNIRTGFQLRWTYNISSSYWNTLLDETWSENLKMTRGTAQILMEGKEQLKIGALPSSMNYFVKHLIIQHYPQLSSPA